MSHMRCALIWALTACIPPNVAAQFDSGSSGVDGALDIIANTTLTVQDDGVHEYTTINVANGVTLRFANNPLNTPVVFLATGDVNIAGTINLDGEGGHYVSDQDAGMPGSEAIPGPGGHPGGVGGASIPGVNSIGTPGGGPGGGAAANTDSLPNGRGAQGNGGSHFTAGAVGSGNPNGPAATYGDGRLLTLSGGSGGAGGNSYTTQVATYDGPGGGAGGGAILIASSGTITVAGNIYARGGAGRGASNYGGGGTEGSGGGAGGSVRLMANAIQGGGYVGVLGGGAGIADGGNGLIIFEALSVTGNIENRSDPSPIVISPPTVVSIDEIDQPTVRITAIDGSPVPEPPSGSTATPDVVIPDTATNPISIDLETANIPDGATISLRIIRESGEIEMGSGTVMSNAATVTANLATGTGVIYTTVEFP